METELEEAELKSFPDCELCNPRGHLKCDCGRRCHRHQSRHHSSSRFKLLGCFGMGADRHYIWESRGNLPGDSRRVQISANRDWFWRGQS